MMQNRINNDMPSQRYQSNSNNLSSDIDGTIAFEVINILRYFHNEIHYVDIIFRYPKGTFYIFYTNMMTR